MVSRVGRDVFGEQMIHNYRQHGIDMSHVRARRGADDRDGGDPRRGQRPELYPPCSGGERRVVAGGRASGGNDSRRMRPVAVPAGSAAGDDPGGIPCRRAAGVRTLLNPAPAVPLPDEVLRWTDVCIPNETEAEMLTGQRVTTPEEARAAAEKLRSAARARCW